MDAKQSIGEAIGEASMCWSETPSGVFDSTRASAIVDRLIDLAISEYKRGRDEALQEVAGVLDCVVCEIYRCTRHKDSDEANSENTEKSEL